MTILWLDRRTREREREDRHRKKSRHCLTSIVVGFAYKSPIYRLQKHENTVKMEKDKKEKEFVRAMDRSLCILMKCTIASVKRNCNQLIRWRWWHVIWSKIQTATTKHMSNIQLRTQCLIQKQSNILIRVVLMFCCTFSMDFEAQNSILLSDFQKKIRLHSVKFTQRFTFFGI